MKKLMLVVNPVAGRGGFKNYFGEAMLALANGGYRTDLYFTRKGGDARSIAEEHATDYDLVACIGGDGTLSELLAGMMQLSDPPPIGYIPMGTANDVASTLGLPKNDTLAAVKRILSGKPHPYDVGGFGESEYFSYIAAFGAFTDVSYVTPQDQKRAFGQLAYVMQGAAQLGKIEKIKTRVEYDDGVFEGELVYGSMTNSTSVAGFLHLPEELVSLGDGVSELVLVRDFMSIDAYGDLAAAVLSKNYDSNYLKILHTKKAKFTFEKPVAWTRDGEAGGEHREIELCNYHAPVQLIF